jgi:hypothetical protein
MPFYDLLQKGAVIWSGRNYAGTHDIHIQWRGKEYSGTRPYITESRKIITDLLGIPCKRDGNETFIEYCEVEWENKPLDPLVVMLLKKDILNEDMLEVLPLVLNWGE